MIRLFTHFLAILLFSSSTLLAGGLIIYLCYRSFCFFVGVRRGRPLLLFFHAVITPVRMLAYVASAFLFTHRITGFRLLSLKDRYGDLGYVDHDYNRKNPVAQLGNYIFALSPALLGLALIFLVMLLCFHDIFPPLMAKIDGMGGTFDLPGALFAIGDFFLSIFRDILQKGFGLKLIGLLILLLLSLALYVDPADLFHALCGIGVFLLTVLLTAGLCCLFDPRLVKILLSYLNLFAVGVAALYLPVIAAAAFLTLIGFFVFLLRIATEDFETPTKEQAEEHADTSPDQTC